MAESTTDLGGSLKFGDFTGRKILGLPFLYWAVIVVAGVLGYSWWQKRKGASSKPTAQDMTNTTAPGGDPSAQVQPAFQALPVPAYNVTAGPVNASTGQPLTNTDWTRLGVQWLTTNAQMTSNDALALIQAYLDGQQLSQDQAAHIDQVVKQYGLPPDLPTSGGVLPSTNSTKEIKQGVPPLTHTVKGSNTTVNDLALLYYGTTDRAAANLLWEYNYTKAWDQFSVADSASAGSTVLPVGTQVYVVPYVYPKYFRARVGAITSTQIARLNGTDYRRVELLNAGTIHKWPVAVGTNVRVQ